MAEPVGLSAQAPNMGQTLNTLGSFLDVAKKAATIQPEIEASKAELESKKLKGRGEIAQLRDNVFNAIGTDSDVLALEQDPTDEKLQAKVKRLITDQADQAVERMGKEYRPQIYGAMGKMMDFVESRPQDFAKTIRNRVTAGAGNLTQQELQTPRLQVNSAGQIVRVVPGTNQIQVLGNVKDLQGIMNQGGQVSPQAQPAINPNPTQAQAGALAATTGTGTADWNDTFKAAQAAPIKIQSLQTIKYLSSKTTTGTGAEQVRLVNGLLDLMGIDRESAANLDELKKNSAILQMGPAGTDMARAIQQMATPGAQIQPEAIKKISDQLLALERRNVAKARYLEPHKNSLNYTAKALEFSNNADPILFQDISDEEFKKYKNTLPKDRQQQLIEKAKKLKELGIE